MNDSNDTSLTGSLIRRISNLLTRLLAINFLTLLCCIPVITIGAALTAMHGCLLKTIRGTTMDTGKEFFRVFRSNLKQSTLLWLPFLMIFLAAQVNVFILVAAPDVFPPWIAVPAIAAAIAAFLLFQFVLPMQAHFDNTPLLTLRSAAILAVSYFPKTALMAVLWAVPAVLFWKVTLSWPLILMFGLSLPGYLCAKLCNPIFLTLEENQNEAG